MSWQRKQQDHMHDRRIAAGLVCPTCGDDKRPNERECFTCRELENNRRYRLHNRIGEYAPEPLTAVD